MCIYTVKKQNVKKNKNSSRGVRNSTERPKIKMVESQTPFEEFFNLKKIVF